MCTCLSWSYWLPVSFPFHPDPHTNPSIFIPEFLLCCPHVHGCGAFHLLQMIHQRLQPSRMPLISTAAPTAGSLPARVRSCEISVRILSWCCCDSICARPCHIQVTAFHSPPHLLARPQVPGPFSLGQRVDKDLSVSFGYSVVTFLSFLTSHINCCPLKIDVSLTKGWELHQSVVIKINISGYVSIKYSINCRFPLGTGAFVAIQSLQ